MLRQSVSAFTADEPVIGTPAEIQLQHRLHEAGTMRLDLRGTVTSLEPSGTRGLKKAGDMLEP